MRNKASVFAKILIFVGLAMIAYYYGTGLYTFLSQKQLETKWERMQNDRKKSGSGSGDSGSDTASLDLSGDGIFGRLVIPKLGVDAIVLEGTDRAMLMRGPGHIKSTAWPHEGRNTAISGHRTTFGAPFAKLNQLENGNLIELTTLKGHYRYRVKGRDSVPPTDVAVIGQEFKNRLTLTTCDPPGSAAKRLVVWAKRVENKL
jgi:sortase A